MLLLLTASMFNMVLCFAFTRGIHVSLAEIAGSEIAIIAMAVLCVWRTLLSTILVGALLVAGWFAIVKLINPAASPKVLLDLLMPAAFYAVGRRYADGRIGDRVVLVLASLVIAVALFEWFAFDLYQNLFNVFGYYVSKGDLDASHASDTGTTLGMNGMRPGARQLLGFLGPHRVGSIFLEPIAVGNFSTILVAWTMARQRLDRFAVFVTTTALVLACLADDRFAVFAGLAITVAVSTGAWRWRWIVAAGPFAMMTALIAVAMLSPPHVIDNTIVGRLYGSGSALLGQDLVDWMALRPVVIDMDSGYAALIGSIGLIAPAMLWLTFAFQPAKSPRAMRYGLGLCMYFSLSLCVSSSSTSIKTAALAWCLAGCLAAPSDVARRAVRTPSGRGRHRSPRVRVAANPAGAE